MSGGTDSNKTATQSAGYRSDERSSPGDATDDVSDTVERAVALLSATDDERLSVATALDRIEAVTSDFTKQRQALEVADRRGIIDRQGPSIIIVSEHTVDFDRDVRRRDGRFTCQRCGADLGTGCFVRIDGTEVGAFGTTCIRAVLGRT